MNSILKSEYGTFKGKKKKKVQRKAGVKVFKKSEWSWYFLAYPGYHRQHAGAPTCPTGFTTRRILPNIPITDLKLRTSLLPRNSLTHLPSFQDVLPFFSFIELFQLLMPPATATLFFNRSLRLSTQQILSLLCKLSKLKIKGISLVSGLN